MSASSHIEVGLGSPAADHTVMYVPHPYQPGCGYTVIEDDQVPLFRLGILPLRCKSCRELITDCEAA